MSKSRADQRRHRRKVAGSPKGAREHQKRAKRRKERRPFVRDSEEPRGRTP